MMIDLSRTVGFEWDAGNARKSDDRHGVSRGEAEQVFTNEPLLVVHDLKHSGAEARWRALGKTPAGRALHVIFTIRINRIRVISARDMNPKERKRHDQQA